MSGHPKANLGGWRVPGKLSRQRSGRKERPMKQQENMRWAGALAVIALLGSIGTAWGQAPVSEEARRLGETWLLKNCDTAEQRRLEVELSRFRTELEPFFLEALRQRPESKRVSEV